MSLTSSSSFRPSPARVLSRGLPEPRWRPGLSAQPFHSDIFAPADEASGAGLALALARLDPSRPVVVEAESSKIGQCRLPPKLWRAMVAAPRVAIAASRAARAGFISTRAHCR